MVHCTEEEKHTIMGFHNDSEYMKGTMIRRKSEASELVQLKLNIKRFYEVKYAMGFGG